MQPNCTRTIGPFLYQYAYMSDRVYRGFSGFTKGLYDAEWAPSYARNAALVGPQSKPCLEAFMTEQAGTVNVPCSTLSGPEQRLQHSMMNVDREPTTVASTVQFFCEIL